MGYGWDASWGIHPKDWPAWITLVVLALSAAFALWAVYDAKNTRYGQLVTDVAGEAADHTSRLRTAFRTRVA
jgi:purine-cytosine permease-like protein